MGTIAKGIAGGAVGGIGGAILGTGGKKSPLIRPFYHENERNLVDPGPKPEYAKYEAIRDPESGLLRQQGLRAALAGPGAGYKAIETGALAKPGESEWEKMALAKQQAAQAQMADLAQQQGAQAAAVARGSVARRGGLSSGAQERMARSSMRDILAQQQGVAGKGVGERADIGLKAEQQRQDLLARLSGLEQERAGKDLATQQFNIRNALEQKQMEEAAKLEEYREKMRAYAAAQQANAIAMAGPKSGGLFGESGLIGGLLG